MEGEILRKIENGRRGRSIEEGRERILKENNKEKEGEGRERRKSRKEESGEMGKVKE